MRMQRCAEFSVAPLIASVSACTEGIVAPTSPGPPDATASITSCNSQTAIIPCNPDGGGGSPVFPGIYLPGYTWATCNHPAAGADADFDGVQDACEQALATAFAPQLQFSSSDCDYDATQHRLGGEYYWGVQHPLGDTARIRIAYLPAYYRDCGNAKFFFGYGGPGKGGHSGDSEFILLDVYYENSRWVMHEAFLSAHCGEELALDIITADPDCKWWGSSHWDQEGQWVGGVKGGAPVVWVATGKHAHYYSESKCDGGSNDFDTCNDIILSFRFPIGQPWQNIGSAAHQSGNLAHPHFGSLLNDPSKTENIWDQTLACSSAGCGARRFNGWQATTWGDPPTLYGDILQAYAGFIYASGGVRQCITSPFAILPCHGG